jgi:hypothetical protein
MAEAIPSYPDPTLDEMRALLTAQCPYADEIDREAAIYWFANHWHAGQWSNLYEGLCQSPYHPGPMESGPDEIAQDCYEELCFQFSMEAQR